MKNLLQKSLWVLNTLLGAAIFSIGFDLFLLPNEMNSGGVSGLSMVIRELLGFGSVGVIQIIINVPLFLVGGIKLGGKFFETHVSDGQEIHKGDLLISFDMEGIINAGYKITTPMIICNTDDYNSIETIAVNNVVAGEKIIKMK